MFGECNPSSVCPAQVLGAGVVQVAIDAGGQPVQTEASQRVGVQLGAAETVFVSAPGPCHPPHLPTSDGRGVKESTTAKKTWS
jgi:hypothetical protein